eukprot:c22772_g1_i1 orf=261-1673(+)
MQALRHASRRALHATVMQETCVASVRTYSTEAGLRAASPKISKEQRYELAVQFVAKFKAANNGQMPGITLLRKEIGGKYETLKEVLQDFENGQNGPDTLKQTVEVKDVEGKTQESATVAKDEHKKQSTSKKPDSKKDKKVVPQALKSSKATEFVNQADLRTTSKDMEQIKQSVASVKDTFKSTMHTALAMDEDDDDATDVTDSELKQSSNAFGSVRDTTLVTDEDDDDDSDVAAPEYHHTPQKKMEEGLKAAKVKEKVLGNGSMARLKSDVKRQNDNQAIKSKHADVKQLKVQDGSNNVEVQHKGLGAVNAMVHSMEDTTATHPFPDGNFGSGGKAFGQAPQTTVVRIVNLPAHISAGKLRSICENVARVHEVQWRRGRIADVQFNVDTREMNDIIDRLRKIPIGSTKLRAFPALKFFCGNNANSRFKPQDANQIKQLRNSLINSFEQRFKFLCCQVEDYLELHSMKPAR